MEFFKVHRDIPFMRHKLALNAVSLIMFVLAVFFLATKGLHLSVEFTGGTVLRVKYEQAADLNKIRDTIAKMGYGEVQVQNFGSARDVMVRLPAQKGETSEQQTTKLMAALTAQDPKVKLESNEFVGPQVGEELTVNGLKALGFVIVGIMIYLAIRFEWKYAVAGIIANLHDVVIILGFFALFQWEFSLSVLAVLGYSVNESVVIFDRIREAFRRERKMSPEAVVNHAITMNVGRTLITHGSTQIMVLSMLFFGGETLHYFAMALTIGICFGIYSSVFVAAAIALWLGIKREDLVQGGNKRELDPADPNAGAVV